MLNIDSRSSTPIYEQIVDGIKEEILKDILSPGDKLPSVREMSALLIVNPNTVSKAYMELERQKVIETIRGKGTFVSQVYKPKIVEDRMNKLKDELKKIIVEAHYMGLEKKQFIDIIEKYYEEFGREGIQNAENGEV